MGGRPLLPGAVEGMVAGGLLPLVPAVKFGGVAFSQAWEVGQAVCVATPSVASSPNVGRGPGDHSGPAQHGAASLWAVSQSRALSGHDGRSRAPGTSLL